jgi:hypothetical protein
MITDNATWSPRQQRAPFAIAAVLTSTLILSCVLWLFAGKVPAAAANSAVTLQQHAAERA